MLDSALQQLDKRGKNLEESDVHPSSMVQYHGESVPSHIKLARVAHDGLTQTLVWLFDAVFFVHSLCFHQFKNFFPVCHLIHFYFS